MANEENQDQVQLNAPQPQRQQPLQPDLPVVVMPETDDQRKDHAFMTKARDRLHCHVPKYHGPRTDDWGLWKNQWITACQSAMHPERDRDGRRLAIKEALRGEAAIQAQHVTKASHYLTTEEMIEELDKIFIWATH
ncbi:MAG: hypothetical protein GY696_24645 [Gammaproteobacteria bacterium]|nr:hypothetical protein [Gammaproteobacteria bacterium]